MLVMAINVVGISMMFLFAITMTDPTKAPTTAAVIPSTNAFTGLFCAIFLKYGAMAMVKI